MAVKEDMATGGESILQSCAKEAVTVLSRLGLSLDELKAELLRQFSGSLQECCDEALTEAAAGAIAAVVDKNNQKITDDLVEQVTQLMMSMGRFR